MEQSSSTAPAFVVSYPYTEDYCAAFLRRPASPVGKWAARMLKVAVVTCFVCGGIMLALWIYENAAMRVFDLYALVFSAASCLIGLLLLASQKRGYRQIFRQAHLLDPNGNQRIVFTFGDEMHISVSRQEFHVQYDMIGQITEDEDLFYVWMDTVTCYRLPKEAFDQGDPAAFRAFLEPRLGKLRVTEQQRAVRARGVFSLAVAGWVMLSTLLWCLRVFLG